MTVRFLVINQHGDNRGDEAALRGMVAGLRRHLPQSTFTVLHQFASAASEIRISDVVYLPLRIPVHEALRLSTWAALRRIGCRAEWVLGQIGRRILAAYESADLVISAPGGPYFGDLYANHEVVHWFYTWMARLLQKPLALYQPSAGPFRNRLLNPVRRRGFQWFNEISVREADSANYIEELTGHRPIVGSDSALQEQITADGHVLWPGSRCAGGVEEGLVAATFRQPGPKHRATHDRAVVDLVVRVSETGRNIVLLPQLHGPRHCDEPYLQSIAERSRSRGANIEVAPIFLSSYEQRRIVGASDFVLAGRYHPLVFAVSAGIPAIVIPYEHKARGFATAAGLAEFIVELDDLGSGSLLTCFTHLEQTLDATRRQVQEREPALRRAAQETSSRVAALANRQKART